VLLSKYLRLEAPPAVTAELSAVFGDPPHGGNDWVDLQHIAAVDADAVDYLVSEDGGIHRRAARAGLEGRVLYLADALAVLRALLPTPPRAPPAVQLTKAYALPDSDPIWNTLRADYPGFDSWLQKCRLQHRDAWAIFGPNQELAGICILKDEQGPAFGMEGKLLKLATFKVSEAHRGFRYGELLLKAAFETARSGGHEWLYVTAFSRQEELIRMFHSFGFEAWTARNSNGELVLRKSRRPTEGELRDLSPLEFHRRFGPDLIKVEGARAFVIPIQPRFHALLFPDAEEQLALSAGAHPFGNAIRKAYLCNAQSRQIQPGSILLFYRSDTGRHVKVIGVAEGTLASKDVNEIVRYVGTRTVYSLRDIEKLAQKPVLAILFRQARTLHQPVSFAELQTAGVLKGPPQSIVTVPNDAKEFVARVAI
jgi:GNAT superfamily N-acetyltransferase